jgi:hypothetical protein
VVEEEPAKERGKFDADEYVVTATPSDFRLVDDECIRDERCDSRSRYAKEIAEGVSSEAVLHGNELAHDIEVRELCSGSDTQDSSCTDQGVDALRSRGNDTTDNTEGSTSNEHPAASKDVRHAPNDGEGDSGSECVGESHPGYVWILVSV